MIATKPNRTVRRGRIFPDIKWSEAQKTKWRNERLDLRHKCEVIFDQVQVELLKTHYNWYIAVEPESGEYFIHQDELEVSKLCRQKYPNAQLYVFRINETGVCGTL